MIPPRLALGSLLALATIAATCLRIQPGPHGERPAADPRKLIDRPRASPAATTTPPPTVFGVWTDGERSFVLLNRPADVIARTWGTLRSGIRVAPAPALAQPLELTLVNPVGWKHVTTAEQVVVDTSSLDNQHTGRRVAHRTRQHGTRAPTAAVTFLGVGLDGYARQVPMGSGSHFRIAIAGHVRDPNWLDGVVFSPVGASVPATDFERDAKAWATSVGQPPERFTSDVRVGRLTAEIDALVGCNQNPCLTYLRFRGQDWVRTTGRVYGILELAGRRYLVTIDADFRLTVIDLSV